MSKILAFFVLVAALAGPAGAQLTAVSAAVRDATGAPRTTFSSGESITLLQSVNVAGVSVGPVYFKCAIESPAGATVFCHGCPITAGNAVSSTPGPAHNQLGGISIASFYTTPGQYLFKAYAQLDGALVTHAPVQFTISSPNITLIYPPNGARGLNDKPLTFRWSASGASRYRVTVADNAGLYNELHTAINTGESSYSYPENPSQPREQLVADQVYYWKIQGLDGAGNVISESNTYNFSLKAQASTQSRNITMLALELSSPALDFEKPLNFKAILRNSGSVTESNISIRMSLGGIGAQDSPKQVASIGPGERQDIPFTVFMPSGQEEGLAVACADLFDDNIPDNCKTKLISKNSGAAVPVVAPKKLTYDEMFQEILKRLGPEAAAMLEGYTFASLSCASCSQDDLAAIIAALVSGDAQLVNAAVLDTGTGTAAQGGAAATASSDAENAAAPEETALDISALKPETLDEWTGYTEALKTMEPAVYVIKTRKEWKRVWRTVSTEDEPEVDFDAKMVAGIISGAGDRAQTVRMLGKRKTDDGIAFDYYMIEAPAGEQPPVSAYIFKLYDKDNAKADFKRLDVTK